MNHEPRIRVSYGDFFDRHLILKLKQERVVSPASRAQVDRQLREFRRVEARMQRRGVLGSDVAGLVSKLQRVNASLWDIENQLRLCEETESFGEGYVQLARMVMQLNDERCNVKWAIDIRLGSGLQEVKEYAGDRR